MYSSCLGKLKEDPWVRHYDIKEVSRHRKGFTLYKITSKIFPKYSIEAVTEVVVWKRFSDFKKLHKALSLIHQGLHLKGSFPPFVKTQFFGRFEERVVEERRQCALRLLQFAAEIPALYNSQVFIKFFEDVQVVPVSSDVPELEEQPLQPVRDELGNSISESLGGTWGHRRETEDVSPSTTSSCSSDECLSSSGGSISPLSPGDFLLFDPLAPVATSRGTASSQPNNSWLLSAIQSCSEPQSGFETGNASTFEFPRPFADEDENALGHRPQPMSIPDLAVGSSFSSPLISTTREDCKVDVLPEAAVDLVSRAGRLESEGRHLAAFESYKEAIAILLRAVRDEEDPTRREATSHMTARYLSHAEDLYERFLSDSARSDCRWNSSSPVKWGTPRGDADHLAMFKIVGIVGRTILVRDTATGRIKVIKTLCKSANSYNSGVPNIVPQNIPFMVALDKSFHTEYAIYLLLEFASAGRLWDGVSSYLQRSPSSPCTADCQTPNLPNSNIYSGRKVRRKVEGDPHVEERSPASSECAPSYVSLFASYARFLRSGGPSAATEEEKVIPTSDVKEDEVDLLISSSKALLQTVDRTLKSTLPEQQDDCSSPMETQCIQNECEREEKEVKSLDKRSRHLSSSTGTLNAPHGSRLQQVLRLELTRDTPSRLPEGSVRAWAAQMVVALSHLHLMGIIWQDLRPDNVLIGDRGQVLLTYQSRWNGVDHTLNRDAKRLLYSAPEVGQISPVTPACDWWSLGALLFELLTGYTLVSCHPSGITSHTFLHVPEGISPEAKDLLQKLLQFYPSARLGAGTHGLESIKAHPFFAEVDWSALGSS